MKTATITTEISRNGIWASRSCTATIDEPCRDHGADFGEQTDEAYAALEDAWDDRGDARSVRVVIGGDTITLDME